jgi:hypothetical protein
MSSTEQLKSLLDQVNSLVLSMAEGGIQIKLTVTKPYRNRPPFGVFDRISAEIIERTND